MGQVRRKLSAVEVTKLKETGLHWVSEGLYLRIGGGETSAKSWIFRFMLRGRSREMGLGSFKLVSLAEARDEAWKCRKLVSQGTDPIEARRADRQSKTREADDENLTFGVFAESFVERHKAAWKHPEQLAKKFRRRLIHHIYPHIGNVSLIKVNTETILEILEPLWFTKTSTASRLQNDLERIFDDAIVRGKYSGQNPARWQKHLDKTLLAPATFHRTTHRAGLPYTELPSLMARLQESKHVGAPCARFLILTNVRLEEVLGTRWAEVDWAKKIWTVPAIRMKGRREGDDDHQVPLSDAAIAVLEDMKKCRVNEYVFPGEKKNSSISAASVRRAILQIRDGITRHGFRRTFRSWADTTKHMPHLAELCLAHTVNAAALTGVDSAIRKAYVDEDPELRRPIMRDWADFAMSALLDQAAEAAA